MEYNSAIKQTEMMAFAATWMDLQIEILNKMPDRGGKMSYGISYMQNLKKNRNELIYKSETDSQT